MLNIFTPLENLFLPYFIKSCLVPGSFYMNYQFFSSTHVEYIMYTATDIMTQPTACAQ